MTMTFPGVESVLKLEERSWCSEWTVSKSRSARILQLSTNAILPGFGASNDNVPSKAERVSHDQEPVLAPLQRSIPFRICVQEARRIMNATVMATVHANS
jgi:hypothetical protein